MEQLNVRRRRRRVHAMLIANLGLMSLGLYLHAIFQWQPDGSVPAAALRQRSFELQVSVVVLSRHHMRQLMKGSAGFGRTPRSRRKPSNTHS